MKHLLIYLGLFYFLTASGQHEFCGTEFIESPDKMYSVAFDYVINQSGACEPDSAKIIKMPLYLHKAIKLRAEYPIIWSPNSEFFAFTKPMLYNKDNISYIIVVDTLGMVKDSIINGFSPTWFTSKSIYYLSESKEKDKSPMIMEFDMETKNSKLIYKFDSSYTFWTEMFEGCCLPKPLKHQITQIGDFKGLIYSRENLGEVFTFIIYCHNSNNIIYWNKGDYYDSNFMLDDKKK